MKAPVVAESRQGFLQCLARRSALADQPEHHVGRIVSEERVLGRLFPEAGGEARGKRCVRPPRGVDKRVRLEHDPFRVSPVRVQFGKAVPLPRTEDLRLKMKVDDLGRNDPDLFRTADRCIDRIDALHGILEAVHL